MKSGCLCVCVQSRVRPPIEYRSRLARAVCRLGVCAMCNLACLTCHFCLLYEVRSKAVLPVTIS
jgi:hypothetical protein